MGAILPLYTVFKFLISSRHHSFAVVRRGGLCDVDFGPEGKKMNEMTSPTHAFPNIGPFSTPCSTMWEHTSTPSCFFECLFLDVLFLSGMLKVVNSGDS